MDKKPKLFSFSRETEINHVNAMIKDTTKRELLYSMVDSFIEIIEKEKIIKETLDPFIQGLKTNDKYLWGVAGDRLVMLAHHYQEAEYELKQRIKVLV